GYAVEYAHVPKGLTAQAQPLVTASNLGGVALTNISATSFVMLDGIPVSSVPSLNTIVSLGVGAKAPLAFPAASLSSPGVLTLYYALSADESPSEANTLDNDIEV